uniref:Aminoacyl-transfer RNA synthetases class-II family profile domain-containing protein n=1 Tax=Acrobeloides nanus TaxID=290746 RepID=A0A914DBS7_9BILA
MPLEIQFKNRRTISLDGGSIRASKKVLSDKEKLEQTRTLPPKTWAHPEKHLKAVITDDWYSGVFRIQDCIFHATVDYFRNTLGFNYTMLPVSTKTISAPIGEDAIALGNFGSYSYPISVNLMDRNVFLADSNQFTLEYYLRIRDGSPGVYVMAPCFRGDEPDATHLNQFQHVECELVGDMDKAIAVAESYIINIVKAVLREEKCVVMKIAGTMEHLERVVVSYILNNNGFPRITLDKAIEMLPSDCYKLVDELMPYRGFELTRKGERQLIAMFGGAVWVTEPDHLSVPFYQAYADGSDRKKAKAADLLIGLGEIIGLGERQETAQETLEALKHHDITLSNYEWYVEMRRIKQMKTSGWGLGSERLISWILQHNDVRDIQILPRFKDNDFLV